MEYSKVYERVWLEDHEELEEEGYYDVIIIRKSSPLKERLEKIKTCSECEYFEYNSNTLRSQYDTDYCLLEPTKVARKNDSLACAKGEK